MKYTVPRFALCLCLASAAFPFTPGGTAQAAVSIAGTIVDDAGTQLSRWATTSVVKTLDPDGDNRYGTWAGEHVGIENHNAPHIVFVSIGAGNAVVGPFGGYDSVDNDAGGSATLRTTTGNDLSNVITYSIPDVSTIPFGVRVGWLVDGLDGPVFTGISYPMEHFRQGVSQGSSTIGVTPNGTGTAGVTTMDGLFFDLTGVQNGDTIRLSTTYPAPAPGGVYATFQAVSFDALPAPEPSAFLLGGLTVLGLAIRRRR